MKVQLQINTNRAGSTVLLFVRPLDGVCPPPQVIKLDGKSITRDIDVGTAAVVVLGFEDLSLLDYAVATQPVTFPYVPGLLAYREGPVVLDALEQALAARNPDRDRLTHHSDRGVQYLSIKYTERLAEAGIEPSVGSVGDSYDNALAETIIGLFKAEVIHRLGPWKTADAVEWETLKWVDWFNNRRLLQPIGNIPPVEAEADFYAALETKDMAA